MPEDITAGLSEPKNEHNQPSPLTVDEELRQIEELDLADQVLFTLDLVKRLDPHHRGSTAKQAEIEGTTLRTWRPTPSDESHFRPRPQIDDGVTYYQAGAGLNVGGSMVAYEKRDPYRFDPENVRGFAYPCHVIETSLNKILYLNQNFLVELPKSGKETYVYFRMDKCSAMVGRTTQGLWVAHVGLSDLVGLDSLVKVFEREGIQAKQRYALASVNSEGKDRVEQYPIGVRSVEDFTQRGFLKDQVIPFFHEVDETKKPPVVTGICEILVSPNYLASVIDGDIDNPVIFDFNES